MVTQLSSNKLGRVRGDPTARGVPLPPLPAAVMPPKTRFRKEKLTDRGAGRDLMSVFYRLLYPDRVVPQPPDYVVRAAKDLRESEVSLAGYCKYVVSKLRQKSDDTPRLIQVFGASSVKHWLPRYRRVGAAQVMKTRTYTPTPERRRLYKGRTPFE